MHDAVSPRSRWQLIRRGEFAKVWWSGTISSFGDWVSLFATLALGDQIGGGLGTLVPLVGRFVPAILFGPIGGVLTDRVNRKTIMLVADIGRGLLVLSLIFVRTLPQLFAVSFLIEILSLLRQPVRESLVPELVNENELIVANSLSVVSSYGVFPVGALVWSAFSKLPQWAGWDFSSPFTAGFAVDFVTFMISAAIVAVTTIPLRATVEGRGLELEGAFRRPCRRDPFCRRSPGRASHHRRHGSHPLRERRDHHAWSDVRPFVHLRR